MSIKLSTRGRWKNANVALILVSRDKNSAAKSVAKLSGHPVGGTVLLTGTALLPCDTTRISVRSTAGGWAERLLPPQLGTSQRAVWILVATPNRDCTFEWNGVWLFNPHAISPQTVRYFTIPEHTRGEALPFKTICTVSPLVILELRDKIQKRKIRNQTMLKCFGKTPFWGSWW